MRIASVVVDERADGTKRRARGGELRGRAREMTCVNDMCDDQCVSRAK